MEQYNVETLFMPQRMSIANHPNLKDESIPLHTSNSPAEDVERGQIQWLELTSSWHGNRERLPLESFNATFHCNTSVNQDDA